MDSFDFLLHGAVAFVDFGGDRLLFAEPAQEALELNESGAFLASRLADGVGFGELVADYGARAEAPMGRAAAEVQNFLRGLAERRLLEATWRPSRAPVSQLKISIANAAATIGFHDAESAAAIVPVFRHLDDGCGGPRIDIAEADGFILMSEEGAPRASAFLPDRAAPALKALLTERALAAAGRDLALHGALLVRDGRGTFLAGRQRAGKTTLALALVAAGYSYGGDDVAFLRPDGSMLGAPFAAAVKPGSWPILTSLAPDLKEAAVHRRLDGKRVRYVAPDTASARKPAPIERLVFLNRRSGAGARLDPVAPRRALSTLLRDAAATDDKLTPAQFLSVTRLISRQGAAELTYDSLADAVDLLARRRADA